MTTFLQTTFPEAVVAGANARRHQKRVIMKTTKLAKHRKSKKKKTTSKGGAIVLFHTNAHRHVCRSFQIDFLAHLPDLILVTTCL